MSAATIFSTANADFTPKNGALLRLHDPVVEDVGRYGREPAARLARALAGGVPFTKDPKRKRFYEVQVNNEHFYIHVVPGTRKVLLLLHWFRQEAA